MKKLLFIVLSLFCWKSRAENTGWYLGIVVVLENGTTANGYCYVESMHFDPDSASGQDYLFRKLLPNDTLHLFKKRISYSVGAGEWAGEKLFTLEERQSIQKLKVQSLRVVDSVAKGYLYNLRIFYPFDNYAWLNKAAEDYYRVQDLYCDRHVFIHHSSATTRQVLQSLKDYEQTFKSGLEELDQQPGDDAYLKKDRLWQKKSSDLSEILQKLKGEKVVLLEFCSC